MQKSYASFDEGTRSYGLGISLRISIKSEALHITMT